MPRGTRGSRGSPLGGGLSFSQIRPTRHSLWRPSYLVKWTRGTRGTRGSPFGGLLSSSKIRPTRHSLWRPSIINYHQWQLTIGTRASALRLRLRIDDSAVRVHALLRQPELRAGCAPRCERIAPPRGATLTGAAPPARGVSFERPPAPPRSPDLAALLLRRCGFRCHGLQLLQLPLLCVG